MITTKYVVLWSEGESIDYSSDFYTVFIDGTSAANSIAARALYEEKLHEEKVLTANLCIIMESTDYTIEAKRLIKDRLKEQEEKEEGVDEKELI